MVTVEGNDYSDSGSKMADSLCILNCINDFGKCMNQDMPPSYCMCK